MRAAPRPALAAALALALAGGARAQGADDRVAPRVLEEGRPAVVEVAWVHSAAAPETLGLVSLGAVVGPARADLPAPPEVEGLDLAPLAPEVLTLEVVAEEDLGPVARAPRPPVRGGLSGAPYVLLRVVHPGERVVVGVPLVPEVGAALAARVEVTAVVLGGRPDAPAPALFVRGATARWSPGAPAAGDPDPLGLAPGGPAPDAGPGRGLALGVTLTRWLRPGPGPAPEVLAPRAEVERAARVTHALGPVEVRPARVGRAAALARAGLAGADQGVRVGEATWAFDAGGEVVVVPEGGEVVRCRGSLGAWGLGLARDGRATAVAWSDVEAPVARGLEAAGLVRERGKGLVLEVGPANLVELVRVVGRHGAALRGGEVAPE